MAKKNGLSAKCLESIIVISEESAVYQDSIHMCQVHKDKTSCKRAKIIEKKVTQQNIDKLFRHCRGKLA